MGEYRRSPSASSTRADGYIAPMATALVTGGAGFLGSHLCDHLLARGHRVICVDNFDTGTLQNISHLRDGDDFRFLMVDITQHYEIDEPVDFVYHMASPASPIDYARLPLHTLKVGAYGTHNTLGLAKIKRARFLLAPPPRSTATRSCTPSRRPTGATSTRSGRAACTTKRSGTPRR